jgi:hypothetical protein
MKKIGVLTPILVLIIVLITGGYFIYQKQNIPSHLQKSSEIGLESYSDWYADRYTFKYPKGWTLHTEGVSMEPDSNFDKILKDESIRVYSHEIITINGNKILIRDVVDAGPAYGRVLEAYIPYKNSEYIWLTARNKEVLSEGNPASKDQIEIFKQVISTLSINK